MRSAFAWNAASASSNFLNLFWDVFRGRSVTWSTLLVRSAKGCQELIFGFYRFCFRVRKELIRQPNDERGYPRITQPSRGFLQHRGVAELRPPSARRQDYPRNTPASAKATAWQARLRSPRRGRRNTQIVTRHELHELPRIS